MRRFWESLAALALSARQQEFGRWVLPLALFFILVLSYVFGASILTLNDQGDVEHLLRNARGEVWAPFAVFFVFTVVGFTGFPQFVLMAAAVVMFGPAAGFFYAWLGTVFSACVGFWAGRAMGTDLLRRYGGARLNWLSERFAQHGVVATALMRVVPVGPFVMINLVAGISHISFAKYLIGSTLGSLPKAGLMAFLGASLFEFVGSRDPRDLMLLGLVFAGWLLLMVLGERLLQRWNGSRAQSKGSAAATRQDAALDRAGAADPGASDPSFDPGS